MPEPDSIFTIRGNRDAQLQIRHNRKQTLALAKGAQDTIFLFACTNITKKTAKPGSCTKITLLKGAWTMGNKLRAGFGNPMWKRKLEVRFQKLFDVWSAHICSLFYLYNAENLRLYRQPKEKQNAERTPNARGSTGSERDVWQPCLGTDS